MDSVGIMIGVFILNFLQYLSLYTVLGIFEKDLRGSYLKKFIIATIASLITIVLVVFGYNKLVMLMYVFFITLNYFAFKMRLKRLIIEFVLIYSYFLLIELIITYLLLSFNLIDKYDIYNGIKVTLFILSINMFIYKKVEYEKFIVIYRKHKMFIILMFQVLFVPTLIIFIRWKSTIRQGQSITMYKEVFLFLIFWLFVVIYYVFNNIRLREKERTIKIQKEYTSMLKGVVDEARKIQHENKNHLTTIMCILENDEIENRVESVINYVSGLSDSKKNFKQSLNIKNHILVAIVYGKLKEIETNNIELKLDVDNSVDISFIEDYLLAEILGNLLENAIEACKEQNIIDRFIEISIKSQNDFINIVVSNSINIKDIPVLEDMITAGYSTKSGKNRGYGMTNILDAIKKYKGNLSLDIKNDHLLIIVSIPAI